MGSSAPPAATLASPGGSVQRGPSMSAFLLATGPPWARGGCRAMSARERFEGNHRLGSAPEPGEPNARAGKGRVLVHYFWAQPLSSAQLSPPWACPARYMPFGGSLPSRLFVQNSGKQVRVPPRSPKFFRSERIASRPRRVLRCAKFAITMPAPNT